MKIDVFLDGQPRLDDLKQGDTFFCSENYFMKSDEGDKNKGICACINLDTGVIVRLSKATIVTPLKLKVVLAEEAE